MMKSLLIETNHGFVHLGNVELEERPASWRSGTYIVAIGTVLDSAETSRLFHATSTREVAPKGTKLEYPIYRQPGIAYGKPADSDEWFVSVVSCG